jgi:hypothetical protein
MSCDDKTSHYFSLEYQTKTFDYIF